MYRSSFRRAAMALALAAGLSASALPAHAQPFSVKPIPSLPSIGPDQVATGDLDGDGDLDLVISNSEAGLDLRLMLRQPSGEYIVATVQVPDVGPLPMVMAPLPYYDFFFRNDVVVGDLDGDGDLDLATSLERNNTFVVLLRQSDGGYTAKTVATVGDHPRRLLIGDLDGDGDLDLATANAGDSTVSVLLNTGDGTCIVQAPVAVGPVPVDMVAGDFDGDGDLDLATANYGSDTASLLLRQPGGGYAVQTISGVGSQRLAITAGDLDGDGDLDLALINNQYGYLSGPTVGILTNAGDATFTVGAQISTPNGGFLTIADLDGDADLDFVTMSNYGGSLTVLLQNNGSYAPAAVPSTGASYGADVATADLDGDGDLDLIGIAAGDALCCDGTVNLLFRQPNGTYKAETFGAIASSSEVLLGDVNNDGRLDLVSAPFYQNKFQVTQREAEGYILKPVNRVPGQYVSISDIALGDLDGDGNLDVSLAGSPYPAEAPGVVNMLRQADGSYVKQVVGSLNSYAPSLAIGDLDGDGDLDLVTSESRDFDPPLVRGWFRASDGSYTSQTIYQPDHDVDKVLLGDLDGDGFLDVVGVGYKQIDLLFRQGAGYTHQSIAVPGAVSVALGDFDGDGDLDLAIADLYGGSEDQIGKPVRVLYRQADGSYTESVVGSVPYALELVSGDLDGDGDLDLAVVRSDYQVEVLLRQADGTYSPSTHYVYSYYGYTELFSLRLTIGDLDNDGDLDLIVFGFGEVTVLRNDRPAAVAAAVESRTAASGKGATTAFGATNLSFTGDVTVPAPLTVSFYGQSPTPGTLPDSVAAVSPFFWRVLNTGVSFDSGSVSVPRSALGTLAGSTALVWMKRPGPGDPWQDIGGAFVGDAFVSTRPFGSFSEFAVGQLSGDVTLPVELQSFTGRSSAQGVVLSWQTATEHDNVGFTVSRDGVEIAGFRSTAALRGKGTTAAPSAYSYTDPRVEIGHRYVYTLRSVDFTGQVHQLEQSVAVTVSSSAESTLPTEFALHAASPNPFNPTTTVRLDLPEAARVNVTLFDALGRAVRLVQPDASWTAGTHPVAVSADGLPSGLYLVRVTAFGASGRRFAASERVMLVR